MSARDGQCPAGSRNYSMLGASYWAYVTNDVLRVHGMCSYGDWFKYQQTLQTCHPVDAGDHWEVDPTRCYYVDLEAQTVNTSRWWDPTGAHPMLMYMHPSNCDRDYERLDGFAACAPAYARLHLGGQDVPGGLQYDRYAKMHMGATPSEPGGVRVPLAKMPYSGDPRYGFLGIGGIKSDSDLSGLFQSCSNLDQCTPPPFTVRGAPAQRRMLTWGSWAPANYTEDDVFRCGVVGYTEGDHCRLDVSVLQIFRFLCVETDVNKRCAPIVPGLSALCNAVQIEYQAGYAGVLSNVKALYNVLYAFTPPEDLESYLQTTDCMSDLYGYMNTKAQLYSQPYLVMDFVLFEISFDWFYQCIVMSPTQIDTSSTARSVQDCPAYTNRAQYTIDGYTPRSSNGDDAMTMLKFVRGGYTRAAVEAYDSLHKGYARGNLSRVKASIVSSIYGLNDTSYPRCSLNKRWRMGPVYGQPYLHQFRALIDTW